jgi:four helix bundle protein
MNSKSTSYKTTSYKDLIVWKKSYQLSILIYKVTKEFPKDEVYGLTSQIRRCAVSIPSNIAEGYSRYRKLEFAHFLQISFASGAELETQVLISRDLNYISQKDFEIINSLLIEVMKMLNSLMSKVRLSNK